MRDNLKYAPWLEENPSYNIVSQMLRAPDPEQEAYLDIHLFGWRWQPLRQDLWEYAYDCDCLAFIREESSWFFRKNVYAKVNGKVKNLLDFCMKLAAKYPMRD